MSATSLLIFPQDLANRRDGSNIAIVDCRFDLSDPTAGRRSYETGHIPGAVFLDLDEDLAGPIEPHAGRHPLPDVQTISGTLGHLGITNETPVVVYDSGNGAIAARAWWILRWLGHDDVRLLNGGIAAWQASGQTLSSRPEKPAPGSFTAHPRSEWVLTTSELASDLTSIPGMRLLDARDGARFRGESEPIDPVAGHVPGAINLPFSDLVNPDGTWRSAQERKQRLREALGSEQSAPWATMCGSGVTACHLVIAGLEAGYAEPRVYVGSWSEWIRDPGRPVGAGE
jgi:thiosulfate/3-mercaptopyruvate sulfurtransferase